MKQDIKRIIVATIGGVRDIVPAIPSFYKVKAMYPNAELVSVTMRSTQEIVQNLPCVDRVFVVNDYKRNEVGSKLALYNADIFISLYDSAYMTRLAKASHSPIRIGSINSLSNWLAYNQGKWQKKRKGAKSEIDYNLDLVKKMDKELFEKTAFAAPEVVLTPSSRVIADRFFIESGIGNNTLFVNPFSTVKELGDDNWAALLQKFKDSHPDVKVILVSRLDEEDRVNYIAQKINREGIYPFPNGTELLNVAAIIKRCRGYLGVLSGISLLAESLKVSSVLVYPSNPRFGATRWGLRHSDNVSYVTPECPKNEKGLLFQSYDNKVEYEILDHLEDIFK